MNKVSIIKKICTSCNQEFETKNYNHSPQKCTECISKLGTVYKKKCVNINCQKEFETKKQEKKYCCRECHRSDPNKTKISEEVLLMRGRSISESIAKRGGVWNKGLTKDDHESLRKVGEASKSRTPWNKSKIEFVTKKCENEDCGKDFTVKWMLRYHRFCSQECANITREKENNVNWNPNREEVRTPYTTRFFKTSFRKQIIQDQLNMCPLCFKQKGSTRFDLHHIDHNKQNDDRKNLIFLCYRCHSHERSDIQKYKQILAVMNQFMIEEKQKRDADFIQHLKILSESLKII